MKKASKSSSATVPLHYQVMTILFISLCCWSSSSTHLLVNAFSTNINIHTIRVPTTTTTTHGHGNVHNKRYYTTFQNNAMNHHHVQRITSSSSSRLFNDNDNSNDNGQGSESSSEEEARRLQQKAETLRQQIREMEEKLGPSRTSNNNAEYIQQPTIPDPAEPLKGKSLKNKTVLIVGANGRLGSMVTRRLLRTHPEVKEVLAAVHYVGEATSRGYGRLSYEVGAEDGVGSIGAAWSDDRDAYFQYSDEMKDYNLNKLRVVEVELLDPNQVQTIMDGVDCVIWCATDFNGNTPRAVSGLNMAFLFRAIAAPKKGRVEIEGLRNVLGALKQEKVDRMRVLRMTGNGGGGDTSASATALDGINDPTSFILVSAAPKALKNFETPFGEFNGLKRQGEGIVQKDFPSLTHAVLQMSKFEDNFVEESLDLKYIFGNTASSTGAGTGNLQGGNTDSEEKGDNDENKDDNDDEGYRRRINRRDAARAAVDALLDENLVDNTVEVWTDVRG